MSARSKFHSLLKAANFGDSIRGSIIAEILGEHARELAEKIRAMNEGCGRESCASCDHRSDAADLIDPEVE